MIKLRNILNEGANYVDRQGKPFVIKGINIVYTDAGRFYGTSLFDVPKTANVGKRSKIGLNDTNELLQQLGINFKVDRFYEPGRLSQLTSKLKAKGIVFDHGDFMDVS